MSDNTQAAPVIDVGELVDDALMGGDSGGLIETPPEAPAPEAAPVIAPSPVPAPVPENVVPIEEPKIHKRIRQFIQLRDHKNAMEEKHKEAMRPINEAFLKLSSELLAHMHEHGLDSIKVRGVGTAYTSILDQCTIADGHEFRRFIIGGQLFDLIDWKANAKAVMEWTAQNNVQPPGVNLRRVLRVNVRQDASPARADAPAPEPASGE